MSNEIYIEVNKQLTLKEYAPIASQTLLLIAEVAEGVPEIKEVFSISNLSALLNKICASIPGEFEVHQTPSDYCQIIYKPYVYDESEFGEVNIDRGLVDQQDHWQDCLWINEKVLVAFIDRKLYGVAFMLYFYLGNLMIRDASFGYRITSRL